MRHDSDQSHSLVLFPHPGLNSARYSCSQPVFFELAPQGNKYRHMCCNYVFLFSATIDALVDRQRNCRRTCANAFFHGGNAVPSAGNGPSRITLAIVANRPLHSIDAPCIWQLHFLLGSPYIFWLPCSICWQPWKGYQIMQ